MAVASQVVLRQKLEVLAPLAERRKGNREHFDAKVKIATKAARLDQLGQIGVCGRDEPNIGSHGLIAPDPFEPLFLQEPQHLALCQWGHLSHLIQQNCPPVALFELSDPLAIGAGKGSSLVTK